MMQTENEEFWLLLDRLVCENRIVIDRPKGCRHPKYHDYIYPLDYGYLEGTTSGDKAGIDVWRGSLSDQSVNAVICSVDYLKKDSEIKILCGCTSDEIKKIYVDHNRGSGMKGVLICRDTSIS